MFQSGQNVKVGLCAMLQMPKDQNTKFKQFQDFQTLAILRIKIFLQSCCLHFRCPVEYIDYQLNII